MNFEEYVEMYGIDVVHWAHVRTRVRIDLLNFLKELKSYHVQILYANTSEIEHPETFQVLCELLEINTIWAINLGEIRFSQHQCIELISTIRKTNVCFMFVDAILVGKDVVRELKDIIRERRRSVTVPPWLITNNIKQNRIILRCRNMWFGPCSLGRNKKMLSGVK